MPFFKPGFCQSHSVNLRTETRILFFEETCFFGIIHCSVHAPIRFHYNEFFCNYKSAEAAKYSLL